jgi:predicted nucleic acid-binding protein
MTVDCLLDTNVLVYAAMGRYSAPAKYKRARSVMAGTDFAVSGQILQEFFVTVTRKSDKPLSFAKAMEWLEDLRDRPCVQIDYDLVKRGAEIGPRYQTSYWDGAVLAAAEQIGAPLVYSEDLSHGQLYGSVRVVNPFKAN